MVRPSGTGEGVWAFDSDGDWPLVGLDDEHEALDKGSRNLAPNLPEESWEDPLAFLDEV